LGMYNCICGLCTEYCIWSLGLLFRSFSIRLCTWHSCSLDQIMH
jgi:hypothetical protein